MKLKERSLRFMVEAYKSFLENYANFKGRTSRSNYWFIFFS